MSRDPDVIVLTPTRGRVGRFLQMIEAARGTAELDVMVIGLVDNDDPDAGLYDRAVGPRAQVWTGPRKNLSAWTNFAAEKVVDEYQSAYLASLGDDHQPRTKGWDRKLVEAIERNSDELGGWAYGDDGLRGEGLPTAWVVSAEVTRRLGWMMLPGCEHLFVDNAVLELGRATNRITYVPDVVIEHVHPARHEYRHFDDASYKTSNSARQIQRDSAAFSAWHSGPQFKDDVHRVGVR